MHCGMCLPTCPTYVATGRERNSPRGRIALMRAVADGELATTSAFAAEMSYCLGCLACTTACPAGVDYTTLLETARAQVEQSGIAATPVRTVVRAFTMRWLFTRPRGLRAAGRLLWLYQASGLQALFRRLKLTALLPRQLRELEPSTPKIQRHFSDALIAGLEPPRGAKRYRVAMLTGCVQDLVFSDVNRATVDVLLENGCEVVTPRAQSCCGSLHIHNGDPATARRLARRQLDTINPGDFDAIISNAGGCGSHLKHYDRLLADDPAYAPRAQEWVRKLKDVSEWLVEISFRKPRTSEERSTFHAQLPSPAATIVTYHEACHLCHGQKIFAQPRAILRALPGVDLRECAESTWCCGSAGIYNITEPETAAWLQVRKVGHLQATGASIFATANPGCHLQIEGGLRKQGETATRVAHPVVLLAEAYRAEQSRPTA
ncbi:MAG: (Fe-S)-binding protein [Opitutaceae bacterium]|nr:(Fe-S)-binding protein [Opitutaceae bacterium]